MHRSSHNANAERILVEAWRLFQQKGYRGVSMEEICASCKITKPTLYYYFEDKETLYMQVMLRQLHEYQDLLAKDAPIAERLALLTQAMLTGQRSSISTMLRDMEHIKNKEHYQIIHANFRSNLLGPMIQLMKTGMENGDLQQEDPVFFAWAFLGMVNTFVGGTRIENADTSDLARRMVKLFLSGARRSPNKW
jgi:AcrR family transcriptional regulator